MESTRVPRDLIEQSNLERADEQARDYEALGRQLARRGVDIDRVAAQAMTLSVAVPSWGFGQGGTRFGRFPFPGEPRDVYEKLQDAAAVNDLTALTPRVSLHIPWDQPEDSATLVHHATALGLGFDAVNSNTFQDQPGQRLSYKFGSLSHTDPAVRQQAIEHNLECIAIGRALGSKALTIWLADGACFPGQQHLRRSLERVIDCLREIHGTLPPDWHLLIEHKPFEPAFYATVIQDWGTSLMAAQAAGPKARCLVDLGHHLPNCNIEQVVARLIAVGRLGGFHFNDSKFADDDLSTGSIKPYQLFLIFHELVDAARDPSVSAFEPAHMIDQSHNLKDPIEDLIQSAVEIQRAHAKALLVDRDALAEFQGSNDVLMAERALKSAFETDVTPILCEARRRRGAAIDPIAVFRASGYRATTARVRRG